MVESAELHARLYGIGATTIRSRPRRATQDARQLKAMLNDSGIFPRWGNAIVISTRALVPGDDARIDFKYVTVLGPPTWCHISEIADTS